MTVRPRVGAKQGRSQNPMTRSGAVQRVVLLRAVNVAGRTVPMSAFAAALTAVGCSTPRTVGASGNAVVVSSERSTDVELERAIQQALASDTGVETEAFVRDRDAWEAAVRGNPFSREAVDDPAHLVLTVLRSQPTPPRWKALREAIVGPERLAEGDRCAYIVYPDGIGRSKLTAALIERKLGASGTSRNWNTVLSLLREVQGPRP